jgi:mono/diheme cytochrome c family protein
MKGSLLAGFAVVGAVGLTACLAGQHVASASPADTARLAQNDPAATAGAPAASAAASGAAVPAAPSATPAAASTVDYTQVTPLDLVKNTPKGQLANPYKDTNADAVAQGGKLILSYACSGCHGGGGGGGMCPALINDTWVYGGDDDTLFRLVTLGSDELQKQGYTRKGRENVVGPMPPFGAIIKNADDLWKIFVFVRSRYNGDPGYKFGTPPDQE